MIAATLAITAMNILFLVAADAALQRTGAGKRIRTARLVVVICGLSIAEAAIIERMPVTLISQIVLLTACLAVSVVSDIVAGLILDAITFPTLAVIVTLSVAADGFVPSAEGALCCALLIFVLYTVSRGRGMGLGDVKLAACVGAALGPLHGAQAIGLAFVIGGAIAAGLLLTGRVSRKSSVPFAPYLATGALAVLAFARA